MKKVLMFLIVFLLGLAGGAAGMYYGMPAMIHARAVAAAKVKLTPTPFNAAKAILVTESGLQSNLASPGHYIRMDLSFQVSPTAYQAQGGTTAGGASGGTGSPLLDARIQNMVLDILRSYSFQAVSTSGGLSALKVQISTGLQSIFGPGTIGHVYFSNLVTQ